MENRMFLFIIILLVASPSFSQQIEDVNGVYVEEEEYLAAPDLPLGTFSWGTGKVRPNSSICVDLGRKRVLLMGNGAYEIDTVYTDDEGAICVITFSVDYQDIPVHIKFTFIDINRLYIECDRWEMWGDRRLSPQYKWIWYRLSGP